MLGQFSIAMRLELAALYLHQAVPDRYGQSGGVDLGQALVGVCRLHLGVRLEDMGSEIAQGIG